MKRQNNNRTIGYIAMQGTYWCAYALAYSFASVFLLSEGYSSTKTGIILAVGNLLTLVLQPVLASYLDKTKKITVRQTLLLLTVLTTVFLICIIFIPDAVIPLGVTFSLMIVSLLLMQSLMSSLCFEYENMGYTINFGLARGSGSLAYAITSFLMGFAVDAYGEKTIPIVSAVLMITVFVSIFCFKANRQGADREKESNTPANAPATFIGMFKRYPHFMLFVIGFILIFFEHSSLNNFFILVVEKVGGTNNNLGVCIGIGAALELPVMAVYGKMSSKLNHRKFLIFSAFMFIIKSACVYFAVSVGQIYATQFLQMFSYATYSPAATYFANETMEEADKVKGQAYMMTSCICGGILASAFGGIIIDNLGVDALLLAGIIAAAAGFVLVFVALTLVMRKKQQSVA